MTASRIDRILLALGTMLILISSYQLFFRSNETDTGTKLGTLTSALSIVKTKSAIALDWKDATKGIDVSENQLIYTDNASSAEIAFNEGNTLEIGENSLVKLRLFGREEGLDVSKGFIRAKLDGDRPLKVQMNGEDYILSGKDADVQINIQDSKGEIGVFSGEVKLEGQGISENLSSKNALAIDGNKITKKKITFKIISPEKGSQIYIDGSSSQIKFDWEPASRATVNLSKKSDLKKVEKYELESGNSIELSPGLWYYRIEDSTGSSLINSFKIVRELPPKILRPKNGDELTLLEKKIHLQWQGQLQDKFLLEWNDGELHSSKIGNTGAVVNVKPGLPFNWRVKIANDNRPLAVWSEWQDVKVSMAPLPMVPTELAPHEIEYQTYETPNEKINFQWKGEGKFEVEIKDPENNVQVKKTPGTSLAYTAIKAGRYHWRVRVSDDYLRKSDWSAWKTFLIEDLSGTIENSEAQVVQLKKPDQTVTFNWEAETGSTSVFELSKDSQFKTIVKKTEISRDNIQVNVPEVGIYYWRSRQHRPDGQFQSVKPKRVIIEPVPAPEKPEKLPDVEIKMISNPIKTTSIENIIDFIIPSAHADLPTGTVKITLPVKEEAKAYILKIYKDEDLKELVFEEKLSTKDFVWPDATPGEYYWHYAVVDYWDRTSMFSDPSILIVKDDVFEPEKPKLLSPFRKERIENNKLIVRWSLSEVNEKYVVEVSDDENFNKILLKKATNESSVSFTDKKLLPKLYFWRVHAFNKRGEEALSKTGSFTIQPPLEKKVVILPPPEKKVLKQPPPEKKILKQPPLEKKVFIYTPKVFLKKWKDRGFIGWIPSSDTYKFSDDKNGQIDGEVLMGLSLQGTLFRGNYIFNGEVIRQTGKVFESEKYLYQRALIDGIYLFGKKAKHKWGGGVAIGHTSGTGYSVENFIVKSESVSTPSYGVVAKNYYSINEKWEMQGKIFYLLGDIQTMELGADVIRNYQGWLLLGGFTYSSREYKMSKGEQSSMRLSLGIGKEF